MSIKAYAYSDYVIVGGQNIGIKLNSKGVMVVGFYKVNDNYIAKDSGLEVGDLITTINNQNINTANELSNKINTSQGDITIGYIRNDITKYANLKLSKDESNQYKSGIYVKDSVSGIGTLTYIDPNTKIFGALGHEITNSTTGKILEITDGNIYNSKVTNIERSIDGSPGEKNATVFSDDVLGDIKENTNNGIFGNYTKSFNSSKLYKVAQYNDIKKVMLRF